MIPQLTRAIEAAQTNLKAVQKFSETKVQREPEKDKLVEEGAASSK